MSLSATRQSDLNPFCLWNENYLNKVALKQKKANFFFNSAAKVAWFAYMIFTGGTIIVLGAAGSYYLPWALCSLIFVFHPYMEITYHQFKEYASLTYQKGEMFHGIAEKHRSFSVLSEESLKKHVFEVSDTAPSQEIELYIPLLSQHAYFCEKLRESKDYLSSLKEMILEEEQTLSSSSGEAQEIQKDSLYIKRKHYYEQEEGLLIQKIELAYLKHVMLNPCNKKRLSTYGKYCRESFEYAYSCHLFSTPSSQVFFKAENEVSLTKEQILKLSIRELHTQIF